MPDEELITTTEQLDRILSRIKFVNSSLDFKWRFEYESFRLKKTGDPETKEGWLVHVSFERPDTLTGEIGRGRGRDEVVWSGATLSSVVKTCWVLVELVVKHELMEGFTFDGERIWNPHNSVLDLVDLQKLHKGA